MAGDEHNSKTILMMGNPNVGKSALFNRLTGANATVSNYPGTTVDYTKGHLLKDRCRYRIIDVPGAYSLEPRDAAEEVAVGILNAHPDAVAMMVLDATRVERGLYLALEVMERGNAVLIAVNMIDAAHEKGISIDAATMQELLGVPVVLTSAISGEGVLDLIQKVRFARPADIATLEAHARGGYGQPAAGDCAVCTKCGGLRV